MFLCLSLVNGPDNAGHQEEDIDDLTRIEGHAKRVDKEQLKPSSDGDDTRNNTIEYSCQNNHGDAESYQRALEVGIWELAVIIHQSDGGQTEQVQ